MADFPSTLFVTYREESPWDSSPERMQRGEEVRRRSPRFIADNETFGGRTPDLLKTEGEDS